MDVNIKQRIFIFLRDKSYLPVLLVLTLWAIVPLVWCLSASFKPMLEVYQTPPTLIPRDFTLQGYIDAFQSTNFLLYLGNSIYLAVASTVLSLVISVLAAYAFARYAFWLRYFFLMLVLIPRILPRAALIVPLYEIFSDIGLLNTYTVLIVTYTATAVPLATFFLIGFFEKVPRELEESAAVDGANLWQRLWWIVLPVSFPGLVTAVVISFVQAWKEFPFVLAFTSSPKMRTLPYALYMMRDSMGIQDWTILNAFTIITIIPLLIIYLRFEKNIVSGLLSGAVKD